jgi:hypothetical protein
MPATLFHLRFALALPAKQAGPRLSGSPIECDYLPRFIECLLGGLNLKAVISCS